MVQRIPFPEKQRQQNQKSYQIPEIKPGKMINVKSGSGIVQRAKVEHVVTIVIARQQDNEVNIQVNCNPPMHAVQAAKLYVQMTDQLLAQVLQGMAQGEPENGRQTENNHS